LDLVFTHHIPNELNAMPKLDNAVHGVAAMCLYPSSSATPRHYVADVEPGWFGFGRCVQIRVGQGPLDAIDTALLAVVFEAVAYEDP
jgi:hypothetical protein